MSERPLLRTFEYPVSVIGEMLKQDALGKLEAEAPIDPETKKPEAVTIIETVTVENRECGNKLVHILYREGDQNYGD